MVARRRPPGTSGKKRVPGWVWLLLGLALGISGVLITELVIKRSGSSDGLAGLLTSKKSKHVEQPVTVPKKAEPAPTKPKLDFYTVLPEVETVLPDRRTKPAKVERTEEGVGYILQAGSFASYEEADQLKAKLALQGIQAQIQKISIEGKGEFHRVRLGPYARVEDLDAAHQQLAKIGIKAIRLKVKKSAG
ncbi:MAG: SPOR domain-containing protein [Gammaproteobacteria bacterium]|nr:SPOR domain-containing protein [Gammaproteobacteria bacterium]